MGLKLVAAAALGVVSVGVAAGVASADPPAPPAPKTTIDHDGTFTVGVDIAPGNYKSPGPADGTTCYWKRTGSDGSTVDNALTKKPQLITIDATDKSFKTNGCQTWQLTDEAPPAPMSPGMAALQLPGLLAPIPRPGG